MPCPTSIQFIQEEGNCDFFLITVLETYLTDASLIVQVSNMLKTQSFVLYYWLSLIMFIVWIFIHGADPNTSLEA